MQSRFLPCLLAFTLISNAASLLAEHHGNAAAWLTTSDRSSIFQKQPAPLRFEKRDTSSATIEVDDRHTFQSIDGFGFALTGGSAQLMMRMAADRRAALIQQLFGTGTDQIGISYLRVSIGSSDMNERVFTYDDLPEGKTDPSLSSFNLGPDREDVLPILKQILAVNPRIKILGSPWTPPSWMKSNDNPKAGSLKPEFYDAYGQYFVKYIQAMKAEGIAIGAITVQNEPLNGKNTPSLVLPAQEEAAFIKQSLGPAFRKAGIKTKIILYDHNCDVPDYPESILADPRCRSICRWLRLSSLRRRNHRINPYP